MGLKELEKDVTKVLGTSPMPGADGFEEDGDAELDSEALDRGDDFGGGDTDETTAEAHSEADTDAEADSAEDVEAEEEADTEKEEAGEEGTEGEEAGEDTADAATEADDKGDVEPAAADEHDADKDAEEEARRKRDREIKVPKYVMDKKARKAREEGARADAAEREVVRLQGELEKEKRQETSAEQQVEYDDSMLSLGKKHAELILEGDIEGAAKVQSEQMALVRQNALDEANESASQTSKAQMAESQAMADLNRVADHIVDTFPVLDSASESFDKELADDIVELRDFYVQRKGYSFGDALQTATDKLLPTAYPELFEEAEVEPVKDTQAAGKKERAKKAVAKKIKAAQQPTKLEGLPNRSKASEVRLEDLSEADFDNLTEAQMSKLRGDTF